MEKIKEFGELLRKIKHEQVLTLGKYNGYDNLPEDVKKEYDDENKKLLEMMREL